MIQPEQLVESEWAEWYRLTPAQRWLESEKLWQTYLALGGSLDPKPDTQSPFFDARVAKSVSAKQRQIEQRLHQQWRSDLARLTKPVAAGFSLRPKRTRKGCGYNVDAFC
jgi:hypothetical protein